MDRRAAAVLFLAAALSAAGAARHQPAQQAIATKPAPPIVQWTGHETKRTTPGFVLVRDAQSWRKLWAEHTGQDAPQGGALARHSAPLIDFDHAAAVAYFPKPVPATDGQIATFIQDRGDHVAIGFEDSTFQFHSIDGRDPAPMRPFGIWVIPATTKPIAVLHGARQLKDEPLTWTEVHRFPGW